MKVSRFVFQGLVFLSFSCQSFAHGEGKPGPHGGAIRMPGAFHTELVKKSDKKIWVYLLDVNFENPTVANSQVQAKLSLGANLSDLNCVPKTDYFECTPVKNQKLFLNTKQKGKLVISAIRNQAVGGEAIYPLPLGTGGASH